jgi:phage terminase large subunit-like protein
MADAPLKASASASAMQAAAPGCLYPEPDWLTHAADNLGYAWARLGWQRAAAVEGAWFDAAKADRVVSKWPEWFCLTFGRFAKKPFRLQIWQEVIVRLLVGWKAPTEILDETTGEVTYAHVRLFRELRLWIPRKNGKSEFLAALALYFWFKEGLHRGEGYVFASTEDQAGIAFTKMADMVSMSADLARSIAPFAGHLWCQELKSSFVLLTGKAEGKHGAAPSVTLGDEMHEWKTRTLADNLRQGEGAVLDPIRLYASTAGLRSQATGWELWDESVKILDGRISRPQTMIVIFGAGDEDDYRDEKVWRAVNPSLGLSPTIASLREDLAEALESPTKLAAFRRYRLNQWVEEIERWVSLSKWDACCGDKTEWKRWHDELNGRECDIAFDSTWNYDFASLCLRFPGDGDAPAKWLWRFWLPAETLAARMFKEHVRFDTWRDQGAITEVPGGVFSVDWAVKAVLDAHQRYKIRRVGWDSWSAKEFYTRLVSENLPEDLFVEMRMGTGTLGEASKSFERQILDGTLQHGGNPVMRWMMGHCHVRFDENMNFVPAKKRSRQSIDGPMAGVMCEALALATETGKSFWETGKA